MCRNASKGWRRLYLTCDLKDEQEFAEVKGRSAPDCDSRYKKALRHRQHGSRKRLK